MSETPTYPTVTDASLVPFRALDVQLKTFPDLFDRPECPYPPHIRQFLSRLVAQQAPAAAPTGPMSEEDLETEIVTLYRDLQTASAQLTGVDPKDKAAFLKTIGDLLTKMVTLREKVINMRQMSDFQRRVVQVLEGVLEPHQRTEFIKILGDYADLS